MLPHLLSACVACAGDIRNARDRPETDRAVENDVLRRIGVHPSNLAGSMQRLKMGHALQDVILDCLIGSGRSRAFWISPAHAAHAANKCGSIQAPPAAPATST